MQNSLSIDISSLNITISGNKILEDIDLKIYDKDSITILGKSGVGKSILIKNIIGLLRPTSGSIKINGVETINLPYKSRIDILKDCGFLFQSGALFDSYNVEENITFFARNLFGLNTKEAKDLAIRKLHSVGLSDRILHLLPSELSGGMYKRVALARAVCHDPKIIFFDEPTTGLDSLMGRLISSLIKKLQAELKATIITVTHDVDMACSISNRIIFLADRKILWEGSNKELPYTNNVLIQNFIGK